MVLPYHSLDDLLAATLTAAANHSLPAVGRFLRRGPPEPGRVHCARKPHRYWHRGL